MTKIATVTSPRPTPVSGKDGATIDVGGISTTGTLVVVHSRPSRHGSIESHATIAPLHIEMHCSGSTSVGTGGSITTVLDAVVAVVVSGAAVVDAAAAVVVGASVVVVVELVVDELVVDGAVVVVDVVAGGNVVDVVVVEVVVDVLDGGHGSWGRDMVPPGTVMW